MSRVPASDFGGPNLLRVFIRSQMWMLPFSRSTFLHRNPRNSEPRIPIKAAVQIRGFQRPSTWPVIRPWWASQGVCSRALAYLDPNGGDGVARGKASPLRLADDARYLCTSSGTLGANGPSHAAGTAANGTAQLQFGYYTNTVPIALSYFTLVDSSDGRGAWGGYQEIVRTSAGGTAFLNEKVVKNKGFNVINDPYNTMPGGATIGDWWAGGGDPNTGAPANPSTNAILIGKNGHTWNTGFVFAADGITGTDGITGVGVAIKMARGHEIQWWASSTQKTAAIRSEGDAVGSINKEIVFRNTTVSIQPASVPKLFDFNFGANPANGMTFQAGPAGQISPSFGKVSLVGTGSDENLDIELRPKGGGVVWLGPWTSSGDAALNGYIYVKDATGALRKFATIA
ncbi:hypothetical protein [Phyllobacterium calauticae]|jgi:hypothetical protein|uniref:hypothetical protein n=1 Tax=Phyllobacterium calauticae TaxID=2817027 RepID=UPI001CC0B490|nr:hypothetical protein [Phyllobacterium calauticae]MBZ3694043.1 hypothetical protein [Phyllobacterium calauticae]